ncbi:MAG: EscU/YscU/HrcU family type III secretion system export apparatus switch protein [Labilithrix sp.]|nr:EscU/YscU/HrcU family type III secretion system export apparatus switch protein [Labilithrix sp.]MCW5817164.1 EscU/YscU/HrcU family type III secretion system export apparatus switch protein [Labilithrix sp.]
MSDDSERTLDPTDARREEFRKQGRIARARDLGGVVATGAVLLVLSGSQSRLWDTTRTMFQSTLGDLGAIERAGVGPVFSAAATSLLALAGVAVGAAMTSSVAMSLVQTRGQLFGELLMPKVDKLNPVNGFKRLFDVKKQGLETFVAVLRIALLAVVAWKALAADLPSMTAMSRMPLVGAIPLLLSALGRTAAYCTATLLIVAAVDFAQSWFTLSKEMKMTRKEREDESKQSEGDQKAKHKIRAKGRANLKKLQMKAVKQADVIVTNPTHVAVALRYGPKDPAPVVLAKGHDDIALRIRAEARKHGIPIMENRRLARALDAEVQVGRPVPAAHFAAVARVLAFVYKLRAQRKPKRT